MVQPNAVNQLTEDTFEDFLVTARKSPMLDLRAVSFIEPYAMVGLLELGRLCLEEEDFKILCLPKADDVLKYLERMDFLKLADQYFHLEPSAEQIADKYLRSSHSDVLLEITPIEDFDDIHFIVGKVKDRAHAILATHLHYDERAINGFIVSLSEVCQNIIEHSETTGFVAIQKYHFKKTKKNIVRIAVMDIGIGFRKSLSERFDFKSDSKALERALLHGASRYTEEGRGHGLAAVRRFVEQWNGRLSIRSGTAKLSIVPSWSWGKEKETGLSFFPGAQINLLLPEV